jgi:hypothetical protein
MVATALPIRRAQATAIAAEADLPEAAAHGRAGLAPVRLFRTHPLRWYLSCLYGKQLNERQRQDLTSGTASFAMPGMTGTDPPNN